MKLLAIDYGRRRIGLATTDPSGALVRGLPTIDRIKIPDAVAAVCRCIDAECPGLLVFGVPLDAHGNETAMSREVRGFARRVLEKAGLPAAFIDESFTSRHASDILILTRSRRKRQNKENTDRIAACCILDAYLKENPCDG
jgi:putative Holliday junction resolvase